MMDMEYNRTSPFISNCLHYSSEFHPYVGEFPYLCRTGNSHVFFLLRDKVLWFAFILLSLSYGKQLLRKIEVELHRCDLLSFYYLCRTGNSVPNNRRELERVVICFHFTIFVVRETAGSILIFVFQRVMKIIGKQKRLFLIGCNSADCRYPPEIPPHSH